MIHAEKLADWKTRHPAKAAALEKAVCQGLGMRRGITSEMARDAVERWMELTLAALLGWGEVAEPERPLDPPPLHAAKKALDLEDVEHPLTGRDRATGERDD
jgi:hypothetical protein